MLQAIRKKLNKKGFTLVELIVVLVILAILAALLIPALTGYIDKANQEKVIAETRMVVMAAQTELSEAYGKTSSFTSGCLSSGSGDYSASIEKIQKLAEVKGTINSITYDNKGAVTEVVYTNSGKTCTYSGASGSSAATYIVG